METKKKIYWPSNYEFVKHDNSLWFKLLYYIGAIKFNHKYFDSCSYYNDFKFRLWHPLIIFWFVFMAAYKAIIGVLLGIVTAVQFFVENEGSIEIPAEFIKKVHSKNEK